MPRLLAMLGLLALAAMLAAPSQAQQATERDTRIQELSTGSVVVVFPDRTRVVLDRQLAEEYTRGFYASVGTAGGTAVAPAGGGTQQTLIETEAVEAAVGLESDTSQFGVQEALNLEMQVNRIIADETATGQGGGDAGEDGGEGQGQGAQFANFPADDGAGGDGEDDEGAFNPVVDLTTPSENGDENIPASGAQ